MHLLLTHPIARRLQRELRRASRREIGGLLMGEHVHEDVFRIVDISVQRSGGSATCFVRHPHQHAAELNEFFDRTGSDYRKYNYLGEWHSHPSFSPQPSQTDVDTMQSIVSDTSVGANFLVLLIVRLDEHGSLQMSANAFRSNASPVPVRIEIESGESLSHWNAIRRWATKVFQR